MTNFEELLNANKDELTATKVNNQLRPTPEQVASNAELTLKKGEYILDLCSETKEAVDMNGTVTTRKYNFAKVVLTTGDELRVFAKQILASAAKKGEAVKPTEYDAFLYLNGLKELTFKIEARDQYHNWVLK